MEQPTDRLQEPQHRPITAQLASDTVADLRRYNAWRRGASTAMHDPVSIGITIDTAIEIIEAQAKRIKEAGSALQHMQANHANEVRRARILKERIDMPMERTVAYDQWGKDLRELEDCRAAISKALRFPVMLRKMWSGAEVQAWISQQFNGK